MNLYDLNSGFSAGAGNFNWYDINAAANAATSITFQSGGHLIVAGAITTTAISVPFTLTTINSGNIYVNNPITYNANLSLFAGSNGIDGTGSGYNILGTGMLTDSGSNTLTLQAPAGSIGTPAFPVNVMLGASATNSAISTTSWTNSTNVIFNYTGDLTLNDTGTANGSDTIIIPTNLVTSSNFPNPGTIGFSTIGPLTIASTGATFTTNPSTVRSYNVILGGSSIDLGGSLNGNITGLTLQYAGNVNLYQTNPGSGTDVYYDTVIGKITNAASNLTSIGFVSTTGTLAIGSTIDFKGTSSLLTNSPSVTLGGTSVSGLSNTNALTNLTNLTMATPAGVDLNLYYNNIQNPNTPGSYDTDVYSGMDKVNAPGTTLNPQTMTFNLYDITQATANAGGTNTPIPLTFNAGGNLGIYAIYSWDSTNNGYAQTSTSGNLVTVPFPTNTTLISAGQIYDYYGAYTSVTGDLTIQANGNVYGGGGANSYFNVYNVTGNITVNNTSSNATTKITSYSNPLTFGAITTQGALQIKTQTASNNITFSGAVNTNNNNNNITINSTLGITTGASGTLNAGSGLISLTTAGSGAMSFGASITSTNGISLTPTGSGGMSGAYLVTPSLSINYASAKTLVQADLSGAVALLTTPTSLTSIGFISGGTLTLGESITTATTIANVTLGGTQVGFGGNSLHSNISSTPYAGALTIATPSGQLMNLYDGGSFSAGANKFNWADVHTAAPSALSYTFQSGGNLILSTPIGTTTPITVPFGLIAGGMIMGATNSITTGGDLTLTSFGDIGDVSAYLNVIASGNLSVNSLGGNAYLSSANSAVTLGTSTVSGDFVLSAGSIMGEANAAVTTGGNLSLTATNGNIGTSSAMPLNVSVGGNLSLHASVGANPSGSMYITSATALSLGAIGASGATGALEITTTGGSSPITLTSSVYAGSVALTFNKNAGVTVTTPGVLTTSSLFLTYTGGSQFLGQSDIDNIIGFLSPTSKALTPAGSLSLGLISTGELGFNSTINFKGSSTPLSNSPNVTLGGTYITGLNNSLTNINALTIVTPAGQGMNLYDESSSFTASAGAFNWYDIHTAAPSAISYTFKSGDTLTLAQSLGTTPITVPMTLKTTAYGKGIDLGANGITSTSPALITLTSAGNITGSGTIASSNALNLSAAGNIGTSVSPLNVSVTNNVSITTTGAVSPVHIASSALLNLGTINTAGSLNLTTSAGAITFTNTVNTNNHDINVTSAAGITTSSGATLNAGTGDIRLIAVGSGAMTFGATLTAASISLTPTTGGIGGTVSKPLITPSLTMYYTGAKNPLATADVTAATGLISGSSTLTDLGLIYSGALTINSAVAFGAYNVTLGGDGITFSSTPSLTGNITGLTLKDSNTGTNNLTQGTVSTIIGYVANSSTYLTSFGMISGGSLTLNSNIDFGSKITNVTLGGTSIVTGSKKLTGAAFQNLTIVNPASGTAMDLSPSAAFDFGAIQSAISTSANYNTMNYTLKSANRIQSTSTLSVPAGSLSLIAAGEINNGTASTALPVTVGRSLSIKTPASAYITSTKSIDLGIVTVDGDLHMTSTAGNITGNGIKSMTTVGGNLVLATPITTNTIGTSTAPLYVAVGGSTTTTTTGSNLVLNYIGDLTLGASGIDPSSLSSITALQTLGFVTSSTGPNTGRLFIDQQGATFGGYNVILGGAAVCTQNNGLSLAQGAIKGAITGLTLQFAGAETIKGSGNDIGVEFMVPGILASVATKSALTSIGVISGGALNFATSMNLQNYNLTLGGTSFNSLVANWLNLNGKNLTIVTPRGVDMTVASSAGTFNFSDIVAATTNVSSVNTAGQYTFISGGNLSVNQAITSLTKPLQFQSAGNITGTGSLSIGTWVTDANGEVVPSNNLDINLSAAGDIGTSGISGELSVSATGNVSITNANNAYITSPAGLNMGAVSVTGDLGITETLDGSGIVLNNNITAQSMVINSKGGITSTGNSNTVILSTTGPGGMSLTAGGAIGYYYSTGGSVTTGSLQVDVGGTGELTLSSGKDTNIFSTSTVALGGDWNATGGDVIISAPSIIRNGFKISTNSLSLYAIDSSGVASPMTIGSSGFISGADLTGLVDGSGTPKVNNLYLYGAGMTLNDPITFKGAPLSLNTTNSVGIRGSGLITAPNGLQISSAGSVLGLHVQLDNNPLLITAAGPVSVISDSNLKLGTINATNGGTAQPVTLSAPGFAITSPNTAFTGILGITQAGSVDLSFTSAMVFNAITTSGALTLATSGAVMNLTRPVLAGGNISLSSDNNITLSTLTSTGGSISVHTTQQAGITVGGIVSAQTGLTIDANKRGTNCASIVGTGSLYSATGDITLSGYKIAVNGTPTDTTPLTVSIGTGNLILDTENSAYITSPSALNLGAISVGYDLGLITTSGGMTFNAAVSASTIQLISDGDILGAGVLTTTGANATNWSSTLTKGDLSLSAPGQNLGSFVAPLNVVAAGNLWIASSAGTIFDPDGNTTQTGALNAYISTSSSLNLSKIYVTNILNLTSTAPRNGAIFTLNDDVYATSVHLKFNLGTLTANLKQTSIPTLNSNPNHDAQFNTYSLIMESTNALALDNTFVSTFMGFLTTSGGGSAIVRNTQDAPATIGFIAGGELSLDNPVAFGGVGVVLGGTSITGLDTADVITGSVTRLTLQYTDGGPHTLTQASVDEMIAAVENGADNLEMIGVISGGPLYIPSAIEFKNNSNNINLVTLGGTAILKAVDTSLEAASLKNIKKLTIATPAGRNMQLYANGGTDTSAGVFNVDTIKAAWGLKNDELGSPDFTLTFQSGGNVLNVMGAISVDPTLKLISAGDISQSSGSVTVTNGNLYLNAAGDIYGTSNSPTTPFSFLAASGTLVIPRASNAYVTSASMESDGTTPVSNTTVSVGDNEGGDSGRNHVTIIGNVLSITVPGSSNVLNLFNNTGGAIPIINAKNIILTVDPSALNNGITTSYGTQVLNTYALTMNYNSPTNAATTLVANAGTYDGKTGAPLNIGLGDIVGNLTNPALLKSLTIGTTSGDLTIDSSGVDFSAFSLPSSLQITLTSAGTITGGLITAGYTAAVGQTPAKWQQLSLSAQGNIGSGVTPRLPLASSNANVYLGAINSRAGSVYLSSGSAALHFVSPVGAADQVDVASVGAIDVASTGSITAGGVLSLSTSGSGAISLNGNLTGQSITVSSAAAISGNGLLTTTGWDMSLTATSADIGAVGTPLTVNVAPGYSLSLTTQTSGAAYISSLNNLNVTGYTHGDLTLSSLGNITSGGGQIGAGGNLSLTANTTIGTPDFPLVVNVANGNTTAQSLQTNLVFNYTGIEVRLYNLSTTSAPPGEKTLSPATYLANISNPHTIGFVSDSQLTIDPNGPIFGAYNVILGGRIIAFDGTIKGNITGLELQYSRPPAITLEQSNSEINFDTVIAAIENASTNLTSIGFVGPSAGLYIPNAINFRNNAPLITNVTLGGGQVLSGANTALGSNVLTNVTNLTLATPSGIAMSLYASGGGYSTSGTFTLSDFTSAASNATSYTFRSGGNLTILETISAAKPLTLLSNGTTGIVTTAGLSSSALLSLNTWSGITGMSGIATMGGASLNLTAGRIGSNGSPLSVSVYCGASPIGELSINAGNAYITSNEDLTVGSSTVGNLSLGTASGSNPQLKKGTGVITATGNVNLFATQGSIGTSVNPMIVNITNSNPNNHLSLNANANAYVTSNMSLYLGAVTSGGLVSLTTTAGDLDFTAAASAYSSFNATSARDILGTGTLSTDSTNGSDITLTAAGNIGSSSSPLTINPHGNLVVTGALTGALNAYLKSTSALNLGAISVTNALKLTSGIGQQMNIAGAVSAASITLNAAYITQTSGSLTTTSGDMTFGSQAGNIGSEASPVNVNVARNLLFTSGADAYIKALAGIQLGNTNLASGLTLDLMGYNLGINNTSPITLTTKNVGVLQGTIGADVTVNQNVNNGDIPMQFANLTFANTGASKTLTLNSPGPASSSFQFFPSPLVTYSGSTAQYITLNLSPGMSTASGGDSSAIATLLSRSIHVSEVVDSSDSWSSGSGGGSSGGGSGSGSSGGGYTPKPKPPKTIPVDPPVVTPPVTPPTTGSNGDATNLENLMSTVEKEIDYLVNNIANNLLSILKNGSVTTSTLDYFSSVSKLLISILDLPNGGLINIGEPLLLDLKTLNTISLNQTSIRRDDESMSSFSAPTGVIDPISTTESQGMNDIYIASSASFLNLLIDIVILKKMKAKKESTEVYDSSSRLEIKK